MPEILFYYGGTITFDSNYGLERKNKLIDNFHRALADHLCFVNNEYYLVVTKEYHKVDGKDDFDAPHLHFTLTSQRQIPKYRVNSILRFLNSAYGRSQFHRMTKMKYISYLSYINKDCDRLLELTGQSHSVERMLYEDFNNAYIVDDLIGYYEEFNDDL